MGLRAAARATWTYLISPGVVWWGLPVAVMYAVGMTMRSVGFGWRSLLTVDFLVWLTVSVLVFGVIVGPIVAAHMRRMGIRHPFDRHDDPAP